MTSLKNKPNDRIHRFGNKICTFVIYSGMKKSTVDSPSAVTSGEESAKNPPRLVLVVVIVHDFTLLAVIVFTILQRTRNYPCQENSISCAFPTSCKTLRVRYPCSISRGKHVFQCCIFQSQTPSHNRRRGKLLQDHGVK